MYGSGRAELRWEPKGVIGNIVPWNFPYDLSAGPLIDMLAAGNRVIIKPSDLTPGCGELLREMVSATFDRDLVDIVVGGLELAREFPRLRWDHLLYTGSAHIGREVAKAAAENLVPLTLELGGKCPAIVWNDAVDRTSVGHILGIKMIKNGQMCNTVDYSLVPRERLDEFVEVAKDYVGSTVPDYSATSDVTGIINQRHFDRLSALLDEAREAGCRVIQLDEGGTWDRDARRMPLFLVVDPPDELRVMREEVFGPILPVRAYDSLDEAIAYVNAGERPLGLYVFTHDDEVAERVLKETSSGGACVNACAIQGALPSLGFGGVGASGTGRHHGIDGFREFSNPRGVFIRGENDLVDLFVAPYGEKQQALVEGALQGGDEPKGLEVGG
jgi:coniferyl-aldehyde dehydrogenase